MADLATLEEVLERLGLDAPSAEVEAVVDAWRLAIQQRVLDLTGFVLVPGVRTEQKTNVQLGRVFVMKYRPLELPVSIAVRSLGASPQSSYNILADLVDPYYGKIMAVSGDIGPTWPPSESVAPWFRWRSTIWPVAVYTYTVSAIPAEVLPILNRAVVEWAALVYALQPMTGRLKSFTAEKISETYENNKLQGSVPPIVSALLGPFMRGTATLVF